MAHNIALQMRSAQGRRLQPDPTRHDGVRAPQGGIPCSAGVMAVTHWAEAREQLEQTGKYWLATVKPNGQPHVMPLFGIWSEGALYFTSGVSVRKARNLGLNAHCVITAAGKNMDLVVEGEAAKVRDVAYLADFGAPSAEPPPYELYEVQPTTIFGPRHRGIVRSNSLALLVRPRGDRNHSKWNPDKYHILSAKGVKNGKSI